MTDLVARTGRHQQRYEAGCRLVAGCIPFKYIDSDENCGSKPEKVIEVLMINSQSGPGLLFPKGGWENDETVEEAAVREALEEAGVRGEIMFTLNMLKLDGRKRVHTTTKSSHIFSWSIVNLKGSSLCSLLYSHRCYISRKGSWGTMTSRAKHTKTSSAQKDFVKLPCLLCSSRRNFLHGRSRALAEGDG
ncbi:nudix hydrolase 4-like isoform X1 [Magnolia sinica]|uniref:nudix hydrolase 4-like isoform X1 n=1 Tax=Magnolia sinica TaxID=86752 RepID=UPI0026584146|nr:nudix hydrolase 4-like isoform X1 [Magnolia sinica]